VFFHDVEVGQHRIDMLVEGRIIIEIKSTERLSDIPKRQLRNYLSAKNLELGILLHFGPRAQYYRVLRNRAAEF
jgi:GxxExxY protein